MRGGYTAGFVWPCPHTCCDPHPTAQHPDPHSMAQHSASPGALCGTRVRDRVEEDAEAQHNSAHVAGLVPLSPHCHRPAVYFRPSGLCPSQRGGFCPREPSSPMGGRHPQGKAWEEESPTTRLKPRAHHASPAKGQVWAGEWLLSTRCHPPSGNIPSPRCQKSGGYEMEGTAGV